MNYYEDYYEDFDYEEAKREATFERHKQERLMRNPDCRDPDHPGCDYCMGDSNGQDAD